MSRQAKPKSITDKIEDFCNQLDVLLFGEIPQERLIRLPTRDLEKRLTDQKEAFEKLSSLSLREQKKAMEIWDDFVKRHPDPKNISPSLLDALNLTTQSVQRAATEHAHQAELAKKGATEIQQALNDRGNIEKLQTAYKTHYDSIMLLFTAAKKDKEELYEEMQQIAEDESVLSSK